MDVFEAGPFRVGRAVAGDGVAGHHKARVALGVHVQQVSRAWPLVAQDRLARHPRPPRTAAAHKRPRDRRVRDPDLGRDQAWPPAAALADLAHAVMVDLREHRRARVRTRRTILKTRQREALLLTRRPPPGDPAVDSRGRREREPILDDKTNQAQPPSPSERRITVFHPGLRAVVSFDTHSLSAGPDLPINRSERDEARQLAARRAARAAVESRSVDERSKRMERRLEGPLLVFALLTIPAIAIEQSSVGQPWDTIATVLNWTIWLAFVAELVLMLRVVPDRGKWLRDHPLDVAIVVLTPPFLPASLQACLLYTSDAADE